MQKSTTCSDVWIRVKTNLKYKSVWWERRMPKNVLTDAEVNWLAISPRRNIQSLSGSSDTMTKTKIVSSLSGLTQKTVSRTVHQKDQSTPQNKKIQGLNWECGSHTNQRNHYHILSRDYCPKRHVTEKIDLCSIANSQYFIDWQNSLSWPIR